MSAHDAWQVSVVGAAVVALLAATWRLGWLSRERTARRERQEARAEVARLRDECHWLARAAYQAGYRRHQEDVDLAIQVQRVQREAPPLVLLTEAGAVDEVYRVLRAARGGGERGQP